MIQKIRSNFTMVGMICRAKNKDKAEITEPTKISSKNSNWEGLSFQMLIDTGEFGRHRLKLFGGDTIKGRSYEDKKCKMGDMEIIIKYDDRFDPTELAKVGRGYKRTVVLNGETHEFLYQLDFINFVAKHFIELSRTKVKVTGEITYSYDNNKKILYKEFNVNSIEEVADDTQYQSKCSMQLFYNKDVMDRGLIDENNKLNVPYLTDLGKKIKLQCFIESKNINKNISLDSIFYPIEIILDMSKVDFTNERANKIANFMIRNFNIIDSNIYTCCFDARIINAQEQKSYTEEELAQLLTEEEREYAELYGVSLDEVLAKKQGDSFYGERVNEIRIYQPNSSMPVKTVTDAVSEGMLEIYKTLAAPVELEDESSKKTEKKSEPVGAIKEDEFEGLF